MTAAVGYPIRLVNEPEVWRGDPFDWTIALADSEDSNGNLVDPVDLTGYGTSWTAIATWAGSSHQVTFDVDVDDLADGFLVLLLTAEQTASLRANGRYDFTVRATGGPRSPFTVWRGSFRASSEASGE